MCCVFHGEFFGGGDQVIERNTGDLTNDMAFLISELCYRQFQIPATVSVLLPVL